MTVSRYRTNRTLSMEGYRPRVKPLTPPWTWWAQQTVLGIATGLVGGLMVLTAMALLLWLLMAADELLRSLR